MRAGILAAGVGRRLGDAALPPKVLLPFDGTTLLARHAATLRHCGIRRCELVVGYRADLIEAEIARIGAQDLFVTRFNEAYEQGSIVSLGALADLLTAGEPMVFMDGDVLCDTRMLERLLAARQENCFLLDRNLEPGEEPVKLCVRDGRLVDCHKRPATRFDWSGEWVGFCRLGPEMAAKIAACAARMIEGGRRDAICEEAFSAVIRAAPLGSFGFEDISDLPWVEIDFPEDLETARREILPRLVPHPVEAPDPRVRDSAAPDAGR